jgi:hypothetical protein
VVSFGVQLLGLTGKDWGNSNKYGCWWEDTGGKRQMEGLGIDGKVIL